MPRARFFGSLTMLLFCLAMTGLAGCEQYQSNEFAWVEEDGYRWAELNVPRTDEVGFEALPAGHTGIDFRNEVTTEQIVDNRHVINGSGVAIGDVTGNGFQDVYFAHMNGPNVLYENLGGYRFQDITEAAGVAAPDQFSTGATFADLNGSGHLDLIVTAYDAPPRLFLNEGDGTFTEDEEALPGDGVYGSTSIAVGDLSGNGAPDIYIANYKPRTVRDIHPYESRFSQIVRRVDGEYRIQEPFQDHYRTSTRGDQLFWHEVGEPDLLFFNDGEGRFEQVPLDSGVLRDYEGNPITDLDVLRDWGLHVKIQDIDADGRPDIYVCNDFETPDRIWMNQGDGTFRAVDPLAVRKHSLSSMAVDFSDINRDGALDFMVVEMISRSHEYRQRQAPTGTLLPETIGVIDNQPLYMGNTLFMNRGDATWAEISEYAGTRRSEWSWSVLFLDVTLDGYEDALISTGHYYDVMDIDASNRITQQSQGGQLDAARAILEHPHLEVPNVAFQNNGDLTFEDVSAEWGFLDEDVSHGMALGDLNNDGTLDVVVNRLNEEAAVLRNRTGRPRVAVRLKGRAPNTDATGAVIRFEGGPAPQEKEVTAGGAYLSSPQRQYQFATGEEDGPFALNVTWPDGSQSRIEDVEPNRLYEIDQTAITAEQPAPEATDEEEAPTTLFADRSDELDHVHHEPPFGDSERQALLPWQLSQDGPAVAWFDWSGNGYDDLFIGSGRGGELAYFENQNGTLTRTSLPPQMAQEAPLDHAGILGFEGSGGRKHLLVSLASYEGAQDEPSRILHYVKEGEAVSLHQEIVIPEASIGPVTLADYTGNGYPDLFVGGRVIPGRYPEPASSFLYRNVDGTFERDEAPSEALENVGLVTGAVFSDLTQSGRPELLLATEWGPLRVFEWANGEMAERTDDYGFDSYPGLWKGVATGDLTGNGRPDIVATNHGLNFRYPTISDGPVRLWYHDFDENGYHEIIEAYTDDAIGGWVPRQGLSRMAESMRFILDNQRSYTDYSTATVEEVIGPERFQEAGYVEASTFDHLVFINEEDGFRAEPLPTEAQLAPALGTAVADLDGDGHEDVLLSQNFFFYDLETPRSDAGRGLLLRGNGTGTLTSVPGQHSGITAYGEQRGLAVADVDQNNRLDVVLAQNGAPTRYFQNEGGEEGIRVHLQGASESPGAIGAAARLVYENGQEGPIRELQAGSGYWSQQTRTLVLGNGEEEPVAVAVRWADGSETQHDLEPGQREITIRKDEALASQ